MEPVPETSQMSTFHTTPLAKPDSIPTLRIHESSPVTSSSSTTSRTLHHMPKIPNFSMPKPSHSPPKPPCIRRVTEPSPQVLPWDTSRTSLALPPRTGSPFSRGHLRTQSHSAALSAPSMGRAKSMPGSPSFNSTFAFGIQRPASPAGSPSRQRAMRKPADEAFPTTTLPIRMSSLDLGRLDTSMHSGGSIQEEGSSIPEEEEETPKASASPVDLEPTIQPGAPRSVSPSLYPGYTSSGFPRQRRPSSPLRNYNYASSSSSLYSTGTGATTPTSPSSIGSGSSPLYASAGQGTAAGRHDTFSGYNFPPSVSSNPTTPSSLRSRSPSISSLETIPDNPDDEEAAVEAERIARKLRREKKDREEDEGGSGSGSDNESLKGGSDAGGVMGRGRRGSGSGMGRDKSKRWSVCGAERRQDLDLETIWED